MLTRTLLAILLLLLISVGVRAQTANAGPDRTAFVNETLSLDGTASSGGCDGYIVGSVPHCIKWKFGFGQATDAPDGWTYEGGLTAPIAYPKAGTYTVTLTVCTSGGSCNSDTAQITVNDLPACADEVIFTDTGNPTTNMTDLQTEVNNAVGVSNRCLTIPDGTVFRGTLTLKNRTVSNYLRIRPSGSLGQDRISLNETHVFYMENFTSGTGNLQQEIINTGATSGSPANYYYFIGAHFRKAVVAAPYTGVAFVNIGNNDETSLAQLPNHIIFDRSVFDGSTSTTNTLRGYALSGSDCSLVNSYLYGFKMVGQDTQAALLEQGERNAMINNFMEGAAENFLSGGTDISITNHLPTDFVFRRNYLKKNLAWCSVCGSYGGVDYTVKNIFELKVAFRYSIQGNIFENHWLEDQNWAIVFTVRNQGRGTPGDNPWANIQYVDFSYNKVIKVGNGCQILGKDYLNPSQKMDHLNVRQTVFAGLSFWNGTYNTFVITSELGAGGADHLAIRKTSSDSNGVGGQGRWIDFDGNTNFTNCDFSGNVAQGFINWDNAHFGEAALQQACSSTSWTATKNGFYLSTGTNPTNNTTVPTRADVKYTDIPSQNLKLASDSPFLTTGLDSGRSGADVDAINALTSGVVTGVWSAATVCKWNTSPACQ